jgi:hypothetical protein
VAAITPWRSLLILNKAFAVENQGKRRRNAPVKAKYQQLKQGIIIIYAKAA